MEEKNLKDLIATLFSDVKKYLDVKFDYYKLDIVEKIILIFSKLFVVLLLMIVLPIITIFFSFGLAYYFGEILNSVYLGFFAVAGILLVFGILILIFKKPLFIRPLLKTLIYTFFNTEKSDKKHDQDWLFKNKIY